MDLKHQSEELLITRSAVRARPGEPRKQRLSESSLPDSEYFPNSAPPFPKIQWSRRSVLGLALAAFAARACAHGSPQALDDYVTGGVFDVSAALRNGPVLLGPRDYECLPVDTVTNDYVRGFGAQSRLIFEADEPQIRPLDSTTPTDYVTLADFDVVCARAGGRSQHGLYMASGREWKVTNMTLRGRRGGDTVRMYGQRTGDGGLDPSDSTRNVFTAVGAWEGRYNWYLGGTVANKRIQGGTSNMNRGIRCLAYYAEIDNLYIDQGAGNSFPQFISGNAGRNGCTLAWYGNKVRDGVFERNGGWGIYRTSHAEQHDNDTSGAHNGGHNGLGLMNPDPSVA